MVTLHSANMQIYGFELRGRFKDFRQMWTFKQRSLIHFDERNEKKG